MQEHDDLPIRLDERVNGLIKNFDAFREEVNDKFDTLTQEIRTFSQQLGALLALQQQMNIVTEDLEKLRSVQEKHSNFITSLKGKITGVVAVLVIVFEFARFLIELIINYVKHR